MEQSYINQELVPESTKQLLALVAKRLGQRASCSKLGLVVRRKLRDGYRRYSKFRGYKNVHQKDRTRTKKAYTRTWTGHKTAVQPEVYFKRNPRYWNPSDASTILSSHIDAAL